jgi:glycosyltransferase involved in cell wall biosynthesis
VRDALDVDGIAECIGRIDPGGANALGRAARAAVEPFTPESMAREYLALYERLLPR